MSGIFWDGRAALGEGPVWDERLRVLYWVDIVNGALFHQDSTGGPARRIDIGTQIGCVGLTDEPHVLIAGMRTGWHLLDTRSGERRFIADPESDRPTCRFNDGAVDPAGRFWTGSLEDAETDPAGRLYRLSGDGAYATMDSGFLCSNGIDWSPDGTSLYFVDSRVDRLYRYAFDVDSGAVSDREVFADTSGLAGIPDGIRVDSSGDLWCAFWDGAHITRFRPDGSVAESVPVPVLRPTSIAFGGAGLTTMYITSASIGLDEEQIAQYPCSGAVLERTAEVAGRAPGLFRWEGR